MKQYTLKEHQEFLSALAEVNAKLPVEPNPSQVFSDDAKKSSKNLRNLSQLRQTSFKDYGII